ncbi:hypothetical protein GMLC_15560 [Geomonas limicola]|uniref:PilZ domain-containing protein n=1 Tax=Geomonas limicola TaxID=2740186 RepID=A0A6V8N879_9BACT|nr:PilZ domain-containing protein [Geomonas limicola]GFO67977.1 hypothetical protein GMLC_15560 [Geomonas limicola]
MQHRRYQRVKFAAPGELQHQGVRYRIRLENISMRGALISSNECIMIPENDCATLAIELENEDAVLTVEVRVVHSFFSMVGVEFVQVGELAEQLLFRLLTRITSEPERLEQEWQNLHEQPVGHP